MKLLKYRVINNTTLSYIQYNEKKYNKNNK